MQSKLDSEKLGVVLLNDFLAEFFPAEMEVESPKAFLLYHYNGLQRADGNVRTKIMRYVTSHTHCAEWTSRQMQASSRTF